MTPAVAAMLKLLRDEREQRRHASDAAMAQQLEPIDAARWLERCKDGRTKGERVTAAQAQLRNSPLRTAEPAGGPW